MNDSSEKTNQVPNDSNDSSRDAPKYRSAFVTFGWLVFGAVVGHLFMVAIGYATNVAVLLILILGMAIGTFSVAAVVTK